VGRRHAARADAARLGSNASRKAEAVLGLALRPLPDSVRDSVVAAIELGVCVPRLRGRV
jgi:hypothetical protein